MELPVQTVSSSKTRSMGDVHAMAVAVQANLVQLKVADSRRRNIPVAAHEMKTPSPGTVDRFRETLISLETLHAYNQAHIQWRLHEIWGQFCLICWTLHRDPLDASFGSSNSATPSSRSIENDLRCDAHLAVKHDEIHAMLWRLRYEQRIRSDATYSDSPTFQRDQLLAAQIPAVVMGKSVAQSTDDELLAVSCEHAGMLAAIRWIMDRSRVWGEPEIMNINDRPF